MLLYTPPTVEARIWFAQLLADLALSRQWQLEPVRADSDATSSDLSDVLGYAMEKVREECGPCTVAFLGSDAPELPLSAMQVGRVEFGVGACSTLLRRTRGSCAPYVLTGCVPGDST